MNDSPPQANFTDKRRILFLGLLPLVLGMAWIVHHIVSVTNAFEGTGSPLAFTFLVSLLLLWWVPVSWLEKAKTVTAQEKKALDCLIVTVVIPAYNEPSDVLRTALLSLLDQTRLPNRIHLIDDGSPIDYGDIEKEFHYLCEVKEIELDWKRTPNRGKRHAQMESIANDDADIVMTLDSDSTLDRQAIEEGLKHFADPDVKSVAGMVVVWNSRDGFLARLTCMLYTSFTRGFRSAQSVLGQVLVNSGTLAFYRGDVIRKYAGSYENERFLGRPMQMNDDSMLTFYALLEGKTKHQPSSIAFTVVPNDMRTYLRQQLRWMRGTSVRMWWWMRYLSPRRAAFWMPILELVQFLISIMVLPVMVVTYDGRDLGHLMGFGLLATTLLTYMIGLRYFVIERSDESGWMQLGTFLLAPVAGLWRLFVLRPLAIYANLSFWKVSSWGTRVTEPEESTQILQLDG